VVQVALLEMVVLVELVEQILQAVSELLPAPVVRVVSLRRAVSRGKALV
jgi:hypothetical protein